MGEAINTEERWGGVGRRGGLKRLEKGGGGELQIDYEWKILKIDGLLRSNFDVVS